MAHLINIKYMRKTLLTGYLDHIVSIRQWRWNGSRCRITKSTWWWWYRAVHRYCI